ncbi:MAG: peptide chain release factor N(5)-glutamine methyltransferase [Planctomycetaceae bacterium]|nr:peptide chain release factor N(5)-glutamine methyltransferase [Planctomycetaceae bacterium]
MGTEDQSAAVEDVWTVRRILEWTTRFLKEKGVESPRVEAELLLAHARNCQRIRLYTDFDEPVPDAQRTRMRTAVQRRAAREPLAYIVGHREFYGRSFAVRPGILVPRPETEKLIDVCLSQLSRDTPLRIAEVGVGSGCISVTLACQLPHAMVTGTDVSMVALEVAAENAGKLKVADRVQLLQGDCLTPLLATSGDPQSPDASTNGASMLDAIVSNPPYIRIDEWDDLQPEVRLHEPQEALLAGVDGLDIVRRLIPQAWQLLKPGGLLLLEVDPAQCAAVQQLLEQQGFEDCRIHKDLSGNDRVNAARRPAVE